MTYVLITCENFKCISFKALIEFLFSQYMNNTINDS